MGPTEILAAFRALPLHRRFEAMRLACGYALAVWRGYAHDPIEYTDGVVGLRHTVDRELPRRALDAVDAKLRGEPVDPRAVWNAYTEPRVAMQDGDLELPDPIADAYNAIYNLFGYVFRQHQLDDGGVVVVEQAYPSQAPQYASAAAWMQEWWTRTWDAWASRAEVRYPPSDLDEAAFEAIAAGDLAGAIVAQRGIATCVHAVLLALAGRRDEATAMAAAVLGVEPDAALHDHVHQVGPADALSVTADGGRYIAICGSRYHARDVAGNRLVLSGQCGYPLRRVALGRESQLVVFAGELVDAIGAYATVRSGEELESTEHGYREERLGSRTIVALGPKGETVVASERALVVHGLSKEVFAEGRVTGAAFDHTGNFVVFHAGTTFEVWRRTPRARIAARRLASPIWHVAFAGSRLIVARRDGRAVVVEL